MMAKTLLGMLRSIRQSDGLLFAAVCLLCVGVATANWLTVRSVLHSNVDARFSQRTSTATDKLAYDLVFRLKKLDLAAVAEAKKDPTIEIIDMAPEERRKFRQIAQQEWQNWAKRNAMTEKIYTSVTTFLAERNLL